MTPSAARRVAAPLLAVALAGGLAGCVDTDATQERMEDEVSSIVGSGLDEGSCAVARKAIEGTVTQVDVAARRIRTNPVVARSDLERLRGVLSRTARQLSGDAAAALKRAGEALDRLLGAAADDALRRPEVRRARKGLSGALDDLDAAC